MTTTARFAAVRSTGSGGFGMTLRYCACVLICFFLSQGALGLVPKLASALQPRRETGGTGGGGGLENASRKEEQPGGRKGGRERLRVATVLAAGHLAGTTVLKVLLCGVCKIFFHYTVVRKRVGLPNHCLSPLFSCFFAKHGGTISLGCTEATLWSTPPTHPPSRFSRSA